MKTYLLLIPMGCVALAAWIVGVVETPWLLVDHPFELVGDRVASGLYKKKIEVPKDLASVYAKALQVGKIQYESEVKAWFSAWRIQNWSLLVIGTVSLSSGIWLACRKENSSQAPEPTALSVTPCADAPVAPASTVAQLERSPPANRGDRR